MTNITVTSAIALTPKQKKALQSGLEKKHKKAQYEYVINPSILGGITVKIDSQKIDASLQGKLKQLQHM